MHSREALAARNSLKSRGNGGGRGPSPQARSGGLSMRTDADESDERATSSGRSRPGSAVNSPATDGATSPVPVLLPSSPPRRASTPAPAAPPAITSPAYHSSQPLRPGTAAAAGAPENGARGGDGMRVVIEHGWVDDCAHLRDWLPGIHGLESPLTSHEPFRVMQQYWVEPGDVVLRTAYANCSDGPEGCSRIVQTQGTGALFRRSGPRKEVYFSPTEVKAAIMTAGGISPGLNTVIRELVNVLHYQYGVTGHRQILGVEYGYRGFYARNLRELTPDNVQGIHRRGGTVLGTSRGGFDLAKICDAIVDRGINQVYIIGGDGSQRGAEQIHEELKRRGYKAAVVGIPKTIDNDVAVIDSSFGFATAVEESMRAIAAAKTESQSVHRGIGIVKLMGRQSGFIAMNATFASGDVDCCLVPEVDFYLRGPGGLFEFVKQRLAERGDVVIVVAEGAGQAQIQAAREAAAAREGAPLPAHLRDASGNPVLMDVGAFLLSELRAFLKAEAIESDIKFIDPTYMIRAVPANAGDQINCALYAQGAVHGAMAGYSGFCVGLVNSRLAYIPTHRITTLSPVRINTKERAWARLLSLNSQPFFREADNAPAAQLQHGS